LPWCKGFTCKCWFVLMVLLGAIITLYHVWILNSLILCLLYPFFCTDWAPAMENNLSACKVFHTFTLPIHTLVCTVLWNISLLCSFGFLHVQCALTLFLQGWLSTSANGKDDSFPPAVAERQHEEGLV
jgi:hypothetical protein